MYTYNTHHQSPFSFTRPPITWAVQRIILLTSAIFALQLIADPLLTALGWANTQAPGGILNILLGFQPDALLRGGLWKPITYIFLHGGLMHLTMNMLWLYIFGPDVERTIGTPRFYQLFLFCGAIGVLASFLPYFLRGIDASITGASGAALGVLVAFVIIDPQRQFTLFPLPIPINAIGILLIVLAMNIIMMLGQGTVSVETHLGGMAAGYLFMKILPRINQWRFPRKKKPRPKNTPPDLDKVGEAVDNIFKFKKPPHQ